ncbi:MAG TPA: hypothetical protein VG944_01060 [Fimbriimonas sp.]|nr:hypothetical protein [Fimbriimonas sp.]
MITPESMDIAGRFPHYGSEEALRFLDSVSGLRLRPLRRGVVVDGLNGRPALIDQFEIRRVTFEFGAQSH